MVNSLENIDKSKVYVSRIEGLDDAIETEIGNTLTGAVSTITTSDLTADKVLVSNSNGKVVASNVGIDDLQMTAGDWIDITNNEISAKGSTDTNLKENIKYYALIQGNTSNGVIFYVDVDITNPSEGQTFTHTNLYVYDNNNLIKYISSINIVYSNNYFTLAGGASYYTPSHSYSLSGIEFTGTQQSIITLQHDVQYDGFYPNASDYVLPTQKAVKTYVDILDSNVVHLSGTETITGDKTFTGQTTFNRNDNDISLINKYTNYTKGTTPSNNQYSGIRMYDSAGTEVSDFYCRITTENLHFARIVLKNPGTGTANTRIGLYYPADGTPYSEAPTPTSSATGNTSSTEIATCGWVNSQFVVVSALPLSPDANTYYFILE